MGLAPAVQIHYSYPDADEMFIDVERELGVGEQEPFYSPTVWCCPPTGSSGFCEVASQSSVRCQLDAARAHRIGGLCQTADFRMALTSTAPMMVCCVRSCYVCPADCRTMPLQDVSGLQFLRRDIPPTEQVPHSGHTCVEHAGWSTYCSLKL